MSLPLKRIAIIDGMPMVRRGLRSFLESEPGLWPAFECGTPSEALKLIRLEPPDLIICEALYAGTQGVFEFLQELRSEIGRIPVLVFSSFSERVLATRVLQSGAQGYLMKSASERELRSAVRRLLSGRAYLSPAMTEQTIDTLSDMPPHARQDHDVGELTNRELEVLDLVGAGMASKSIAEALHISLKTVEAHRSHIRTKLALDNAAELICYASQWHNLNGHRFPAPDSLVSS